MISTHILDTSLGIPAANVEISLEKQNQHDESHVSWILVDKNVTNSDGRIAFNCPKEIGIYRLNFGIEAYYKTLNTDFFFLDNSIVFKVLSIDRKYHVPILLNPYGYTTYRGS